MTQIKEVKFVPGCFDNFEGTQEELDTLMKELQEMFLNMTPEELESRSRPIDLEELEEELSSEEIEKLFNALSDEAPKRNLN